MDSFQEIFDLACQYCQMKLSDVAYKLWIQDLIPVKFDGSTAVLSARTDFKRSIVEEKYKDLLASALEQVIGFPVEVEITCEEPAEAAPAPSAPAKPAFSNIPAPQPGSGSYNYTFDTFIIGPSNRFAHAACQAVAKAPAQTYNPLFIYGDSGLGKTHLVLAICNEVKRTHPDFNILYIKGEEFTNELINAIARKDTQSFHEKYRAVDLLAVDDIQFISGKVSTQEEFFHTFDALHQLHKQIVLASDRPPRDIKTLDERLRTRFEQGLIADVQHPELETRIAIIRRKAELMGLDIPDEVVDYIAKQLKNNIRQLEGTVQRLNALKNLAGTNPTILVAQEAIRSILSDHQPIPMTVERIITEVARTYSVTPDDIRSNKRSSAISVARQVAMYVVREITQMSMSAIGEEFGGRDHSTVVYSLKEVEKSMKKDQHYRETVEDIIKNIRTL